VIVLAGLLEIAAPVLLLLPSSKTAGRHGMHMGGSGSGACADVHVYMRTLVRLRLSLRCVCCEPWYHQLPVVRRPCTCMLVTRWC
jgi:hypothetical protein